MKPIIELMKGLSVIIPAYNEERRISTTVRRVLETLGGKFDLEIIVVDDGSRDLTSRAMIPIVSETRAVRLLTQKTNRGKGHAVRTGMLAATKEVIMFMDVDLSTPPELCEKFAAVLGPNSPVVIGTRKVGRARIIRRQPFFREFCGKNFTFLTRVLFGLNTSDFTCGFKMFTAHAARKIFSRAVVNRWSFDAEIIILAHQYFGEVREIPVVWENSTDSRVRLFRDIVVSLLELIWIKWRRLFT